MSYWAGLPVDLLDAITKRLDSYGDYVRLRAVCMQWKSALPKKPRHQHLCHEIPWLILPYDDESKTLRSFFNLIENKVYHLELPEARGKVFRGSCFGWLVTVETGGALHLLNPFTKAQIDLPPISTFPTVKEYRANECAIVGPEGTIIYLDTYNFVRKVILSSSPTSSIHDDYMAVAIYGGADDLAFCRRGDKKWTAISTSNYWYKDIIFHEEKLYALTGYSELVVCDMSSTPKEATILVEPPQSNPFADRYLVAADGELLMIETELDRYKIVGFNTYKLNLTKRRWSKLKSLGDQVLLLGDISSSSVSPHNFPNCKGNCIYYNDDTIYDLENKTYQGIGVLHGLVGYKENTKHSCPVWVLSSIP